MLLWAACLASFGLSELSVCAGTACAAALQGEVICGCVVLLFCIPGGLGQPSSSAVRTSDCTVLLQCKADFSDLSVGALILSVRPSGRNLGRKVGKKCRF